MKNPKGAIIWYKLRYEIYKHLKKTKFTMWIFEMLFGDFTRFLRPEPKKFENELSVCAIFKDEAPYIKEWIEFHLMVGVDKFYLYDNASNDNAKDVLKPYIEKGIVKYHRAPGKKMHVAAFEHGKDNYKYNTRWMAFIDIDEFIVPLSKETIPEVLKEFEGQRGLKIQWNNFDSNGHAKKPQGLVTKNYKTCTGVTETYKSISNPRKMLFCHCTHASKYYGQKYAVDEKGIEVQTDVNPNFSADKIVIHHYFCKSLEEHITKCRRGFSDSNREYVMPSEPLVYENHKTDNTMDKYIDELEKRCGISEGVGV